MKRKIIALMLLLINFGVCAKDRKIYLNCEGQEVINRAIYPEKNTASNKIFSIEMVLTEGKVSFKKTSVPLTGFSGRLKEKDGLLETVSDSEYSIFISYNFLPPIKGGGEGSFIINRFTGKAKSVEYFTFANQVEADVFTLEGNYSCVEQKNKKF
jgi:hypothetical protein